MRRSALMRSRCSWVRVRLRGGIISPRPRPGSALSSLIAGSPADVVKTGKNRASPGLVVWIRPLGDLHFTVPSANCFSAQPPTPVQNVFKR
jgi:hypothetical protein